jgi:membrane-associated phospholipid phosphatase
MCRRFALIASNIPVSSTSDNPLQAQSAIQALLASTGSGAAQAATLQGAAADSQQAQQQAVLGADNFALQLDQAIHQWVEGHTTLDFRLMADVWISDAFITAGVLGWVACTAACLAKAPSKSAGPLAAAWGFYFATCGAVGHGDPLLVDALKHLFARVRPSTLHHTFSFPSGHTAAAVFIAGSLLTVLLPLTLRLWSAPQSAGSSIDNSTGSQVQGSGEAAAAAAAAGLGSVAALDAAILGVWAAAWGTTAVGRILSESHWLSDTLAGGCLAVASVSGLALTSRLLMPTQLPASSSEGAASGQSES